MEDEFGQNPLVEKPFIIHLLETGENSIQLVRKLLYTFCKARSPGKGILVYLTKTDDIPQLFLKVYLIILVMSKETILILDKDFHTQWTLKTILESEKYIVLAVDTIERALTNFQEFEVSGFITEKRIDHTNIHEIIRELKKSFPELYVMMLTDENFKEKEYKKIMSAGIDDLFLKPFSIERILIHLQKGLRHRKVLLQKKRLEQRLSEIRTDRNVREVVLSRDNLSQKNDSP